LEKGGEQAIHRTRVASRRLREVLPILELDRESADRLGRRLRRVTKRLGTVREQDALLQLLGELHDSGKHDDRALARVSAAVSEQRTSEQDRLRAKLPMGELRRIVSKIEKIEKALGERDLRQSSARAWRWAIDARIAQRAGALKAAINEAGAVYLPGRVHDVRIALKKFRYAAELANEVSGDRAWHDDLLLLKRMQDLLGRLRDRQVFIERVREVQASLTPPDLAVWRGLDALVATIEKECRRLHARYVRDAAKLAAICDRVGERARPAAPASHRQVG
jgi:CHAD domain-containing protein